MTTKIQAYSELQASTHKMTLVLTVGQFEIPGIRSFPPEPWGNISAEFDIIPGGDVLISFP